MTSSSIVATYSRWLDRSRLVFQAELDGPRERHRASLGKRRLEPAVAQAGSHLLEGTIKVGSYAPGPGPFGRRLSVRLGRSAFANFFPDRAFVVRSGESPVEGFLLTGPSILFARLRHRQVRFVDRPQAPTGFNPAAGPLLTGNLAKVIAAGSSSTKRSTVTAGPAPRVT